MHPNPFLANPPDLDADVLYAVDRGPRNVDLLEQMPDRQAYRLVRELQPGQDISHWPVVVKPQSVVRGPAVEFRTTIVNRSGAPTVTTYARWGAHEYRRVLDRASRKDEEYEVAWTLSPDGVTFTGPDASASRTQIRRRAGTFTVGATFAARAHVARADSSERRYTARTRVGSTEVLTADEQWTYFAPPIRAWLPVAVTGTLDVSLSG
jgi:hypothetical protein